MQQNNSKVTPAGIAPLANIAIAERAISRALGRGLHQPGLVVMHGPSGYRIGLYTFLPKNRQPRR